MYESSQSGSKPPLEGNHRQACMKNQGWLCWKPTVKRMLRPKEKSQKNKTVRVKVRDLSRKVNERLFEMEK